MSLVEELNIRKGRGGGAKRKVKDTRFCPAASHVKSLDALSEQSCIALNSKKINIEINSGGNKMESQHLGGNSPKLILLEQQTRERETKSVTQMDFFFPEVAFFFPN